MNEGLSVINLLKSDDRTKRNCTIATLFFVLVFFFGYVMFFVSNFEVLWLAVIMTAMTICTVLKNVLLRRVALEVKANGRK